MYTKKKLQKFGHPPKLDLKIFVQLFLLEKVWLKNSLHTYSLISCPKFLVFFYPFPRFRSTPLHSMTHNVTVFHLSMRLNKKSVKWGCCIWSPLATICCTLSYSMITLHSLVMILIFPIIRLMVLKTIGMNPVFQRKNWF